MVRPSKADTGAGEGAVADDVAPSQGAMSAARMVSAATRTQARSRMLKSSRMLPGQR
jgi:hypothetical protein